MDKDNHIGKPKEKEKTELYYDEWYDQTKSELLETLNDVDIESRRDDEVNIDNFYNGD